MSYDDATRTLFVSFVEGAAYAYFEAPPDLFVAFRAARSTSGFFARKMRDRYQKLDRPDGPPDPEPSLVRASGGPAWRPPAAAGR